jgi:hypothetical protein
MVDLAVNEPYNARHRPSPIGSVRPYVPVVFNKQSRTRFARNRWGELVRHLGRDPSFPEKLIINRIVAIEWELLRTDAKIDRGDELSGHDIRGRLAAENRLRLDLVALGLEPRVVTTGPRDATEFLRERAKAAGASR